MDDDYIFGYGCLRSDGCSKGVRKELIDEISKFKWQNIGELITLCKKCQTKEEADYLIRCYKRICPEYWEQNLGYIFGYCNDENRKKLYSLFSVIHPIFGSGFGREG